ncbi:MAG: radical SAM family heme chaperone HemW [Endozoicomonadaceae bacterium]|nr:radical SAM family heme chaperone HemW [Endozoicomonadaceae bacterium]MBE8232694.1 radical SAM family heme chaperone HemW [Endozoicomonadaceae bacterium]
MLIARIPLSLYIHIPWCVKKCPYCDFNSHRQPENFDALEVVYIDKLIEDFIQDLPFAANRTLHSIFIGGGTPSLFSPKSFERLLSTLSKHIHFNADLEITLEANPGAIEHQKFLDFRIAGINRLSIGVQSFQNSHLKKLGRIHTQEEARLAITFAKSAEFKEINLDLMYGLPNQTVCEVLRDLTAAMDYSPSHISWYQLTLEPNTVFYKRPPILPYDDLIADMQQQGSYLLTQSHFQQYEISAWSQPGYESQHNLNYWQFGDYIGIGAGAHGKYTIADSRIMRRWKVRMPNAYINSDMSTIAQEKQLLIEELPLEFFMNTLRLKQGVPTASFQQYTNLPLSKITSQLDRMVQKGWMHPYQDCLQPTSFGQLFLNDILEEWMP